MSSTSTPPSAPPTLAASAAGVRPSVRVQLAELAVEAALSVPGVSAMEADPQGVHKTPAPGGELKGVGAAVTADGRYEIGLHLQAELVPLHPLGDRVRQAVQRAASGAGLGEALGRVTVSFEDLAPSARGAASGSP